MNNQNLEPLLDDKELSLLLKVSIATLRYWRSRGSGPSFRKVGPHLVRYAPSDVQSWLEAQSTGGDVAAEASR